MAAYVAGDLGDADRDAVDRHLDVCGPCQDRVAEMLAAEAEAEGLDGELPSPGLRDRVLAVVELTPQDEALPPGPSDQGDCGRSNPDG